MVVLGIGHDWNQPYSCESWATTFGLTYPVIDDVTNIYGLFGTGYIPHNIVIGGDGEVLYSESGFNQTAIISFINEGLENLDQDYDNDGINDSQDNCIENYNPAQLDDDYDGIRNQMSCLSSCIVSRYNVLLERIVVYKSCDVLTICWCNRLLVKVSKRWF